MNLYPHQVNALDEAKKEIERRVEKYYTGERNYYQELLDKFTEKRARTGWHRYRRKEIILIASIITWARKVVNENIKNNYQKSIWNN